MIKTTHVLLAFLPWCFLSFTPNVQAKMNVSETVPLHDCKGSCIAKKTLSQLRKSKKKIKPAYEACPQELSGIVKFKNINGRERGICLFSDNSSLELKDIQNFSESK